MVGPGCNLWLRVDSGRRFCALNFEISRLVALDEKSLAINTGAPWHIIILITGFPLGSSTFLLAFPSMLLPLVGLHASDGTTYILTCGALQPILFWLA